MQTQFTAINNLLQHLFADKRSVYIDDIIVTTDNTYEIWWCRHFTLQNKEPVWQSTALTRMQLITYIHAERLNYWESFRYDDTTGNIQPFTNCQHDTDIFLDENYREVIKQWLEDQNNNSTTNNSVTQ